MTARSTTTTSPACSSAPGRSTTGSGSSPTGQSISVGPPRAMPREMAAPSSSGDFTRSACEAEAFAQLDEVRIAQVAGDGAVVEGLLLDALDVAVGAVAEHDRDHADAVLRGRRHLHGGEQEAAVAADRHDRRVGLGDLDAERGGVAPAQRALVAGRQEGARLVGRLGEARGVAHLRQLIDQDAVLGQRLADGLEIGDLRRELVAHRLGRRAPWSRPRASARPLRLALCLPSLSASAFSVAVASPTMPISGRRWRSSSSLSMSMRMILSSSSRPQFCCCGCRRVPTASTTSASPQKQVAGRHGDRQAMAAVDHALAHAAGHDRRVEHLGDRARRARPRPARRRRPRSAAAARCPEAWRRARPRPRRRGRGRPWPASRSARPAPCAPRCPSRIRAPTGRRRPDSRRRKASLTRPGASAGALMRSAHLVRPRMIASWSGSSCSSPTLRPIMACWIWPVSASTGAFTA